MDQNLKVIGAGLGRTGTTSLKLALEFLLGGACFHFLEYQSHPESMAPWRSFTEKLPIDTKPGDMPEVPISQWQLLMPGYTACVDEPSAFYWLPLSRAFSQALIILTVRDTESWWSSMHALIQHREREWADPESISPGRLEFLEFENAVYGTDESLADEAVNKDRFERHNRAVIDYGERHQGFGQRLLVWNVKEGWEPLCQALNLSVPDMPFPHANKREEFHGY